MEDYKINGKSVGCGNCKDKYICRGCRARAYSYFNGNARAPDIGVFATNHYGLRLLKIRVIEDRCFGF